MRPTERQGKKRLIYTMGDSSIFGHGLSNDQTLHAHITQECDKMNISAEAITGAVPGYSSVQSLHQLNSVGWSLKPDLLIVGNLWSDNDIISAEQSSDGQINPEDEPEGKLNGEQEGESWLTHNSALWRELVIAFHATGDSLSKIGWMDKWEDIKGFRRVPPTRYAKALDTIALEAARRNISVLFLSPCNMTLTEWDRPEEEQPEDGFPWDVYFEIMKDVAQRRSIPFISGCTVAEQNQLQGQEAFLDQMHPTSTLNQAYAKSIVQLLQKNNWPQSHIIPQKKPPYSKIWTEKWSSVYPEPQNNSGIIRPDNMDFNIKNP